MKGNPSGIVTTSTPYLCRVGSAGCSAFWFDGNLIGGPSLAVDRLLIVLVGGVLGWGEEAEHDMAMVAIVLLIAVPIVFFIARWFYLHRAERDVRWTLMYRTALRRNLDNEEVGHLRRFFATLTREEQDLIVVDPRKLRARLAKFLSHDESSPSRVDVRILDKLFPEVKWHLDIQSPRDLQPGEVCSVEFKSDHRMGWVLKIREEDLLVSMPDWKPETILDGEHATIYFYRPGVGGFELGGVIKKAAPNGIVFRFDGTVHSNGEQHLMALLELDMTLHAWPPAEKGTPKSPSESDADKESASAGDVEILCKTERISDRGVLFKIIGMKEDGRESPVPNYIAALLKTHETWETEIVLPDGYTFSARGRLIPSMRTKGNYIMKFLDIGEAARSVLMVQIKRSGAAREQLI